LKRLGQTSSGEPLYAIPGSGPDKSSDGPDAFLWQDGLDRWVKYTRFADECQGMGD